MVKHKRNFVVGDVEKVYSGTILEKKQLGFRNMEILLNFTNISQTPSSSVQCKTACTISFVLADSQQKLTNVY